MTQVPTRVLRVYHSAVVGEWRNRERCLRNECVEVTVVAPSRWNEGGRDVALRVEPGESVVEAATVGHHPFVFGYHPLPIWRALRRSPIDVLDIHEEPASFAAFEVLVLARLAGIRPSVTLYSAQNLDKAYPPPFRWFERLALRRAAAVHSCNDAVTGVLRRKRFRGDVVNLGLGVDVDAFRPQSDGSAARADTDATFHVGYVGRIEDRKGVFTLLTAIGATTGMTVEFVGDGDAAERLSAAILARSLDDRAKVSGYANHDDLGAVYRSFDVVVVPSLDTPSWVEQFGRVVVEAMASGVPVVVSDSGSLPEVAGDAGLVVPQCDARALAAALEKLRDSPELRADLLARGLARAREFSWEHIARRQADLYRRVAVKAVQSHPNANRGSAA